MLVRKWSKLRRPHSEQPDLSIRNLSKKTPSTFGMTTLPSLQPQKGQPQLFSHFLQRVSGGFHQVFPCALPPPLERAHAFPYLRIARLALFRWQTSRDGLLEDLPEAIYVTRVDLDFPPVLQGFSYNVHIYCYWHKFMCETAVIQNRTLTETSCSVASSCCVASSCWVACSCGVASSCRIALRTLTPAVAA